MFFLSLLHIIAPQTLTGSINYTSLELSCFQSFQMCSFQPLYYTCTASEGKGLKKLAFINQWLQQKGSGIQAAGFFEILQLQMEGGIEFALQYPELNQFLMSIMKNPELRAKAEELSPQYYNEVFDPLIKDAIERGELRSDLEPNFMKQLIKYSWGRLCWKTSVMN